MRQKTALMSLPVETRKLAVKGPVEMYVESRPLERVEARSSVFTEQEAYWKLPLEEATFVSDLAVCQAASRSPGRKRSDVIYISTVNPIGLYAMSVQALLISCIDLYDIFPANISHHKPRVLVHALPAPLDDSVILHEEVTNSVLMVNVASGLVTRLLSQSMPEAPLDMRRWPSYRPTDKNPFRLCKSSVSDPYASVIFYKKNGDLVEVLGMLEGISHTVQLPISIGNLQQVAMDTWLVEEAKSNKKYLLNRKTSTEFVLQYIQESGEGLEGEVLLSSVTALSPNVLSQALGQTIESPNRVVATPNSYASVLLGFPDLSESDLYTIPRDALPESIEETKGDPLSGLLAKPGPENSRVNTAFLPESGQVIRALPTWKVPKGIIEDESKARDLNGFLEVTDMANHKLRYIPVPEAVHVPPYMSQLFSIYGASIFMAPLSGDGLVTLDMGGCLRLWETGLVHLQRSLQEWRSMLGYEDTKPLQLNIERESGRDHEDIDPKHGKMDPDNAPHVGGNTWAGGVGGSGTAGLGGFGGPYRLDAGHTVYQVPDWEKDAVPESVRQAAREVAQKAYKERLREIKMSDFDAETYERFSKNVRGQVQSLRVILDSLQAKGKERQWLKNQTYGDLDDARLIEGLTGEKAIYKRRGEKEPEMGSPQEHPKRLRLLVDVSGSMYRFNGHDGRLEREMEAALMVMEAFEKYEDKFKYDIFGHSGEDHRVEFVNADKPPRNDKERLVVLKLMHAHAQFCLSGDTTLEATKHAIETVSKEEADEHFVIVLSDANFDRYGIRPSRFGEILTGGEDVSGYAIFIGSLGDQAIRLSKQLPMGHSYICMDTKNLPQILQQIFTSTMLST